MARGGFNFDGMSKGLILILGFVVVMWLMNNQKPLVPEMTTTLLWAVGALSVWTTVVATHSMRSPIGGWIGGFITYVGLLYIVGGVV